MGIPEEKPETGSSQGFVILSGMLSLSMALIVFAGVYVMMSSGVFMRNFASMISTEGRAKGVMSVMVVSLLLLVIMISIFGFQTVVPNLLRDKDRQEQATKMLRERVIPIAATMFFILFMYQFMFNGVEMSPRASMMSKLGIVSIFGVAMIVVQLIRMFMEGSPIFQLLIGAGLAVASMVAVVIGVTQFSKT